MRAADLLKRKERYELPRLAGAAQEPGEQLVAAMQYMEPREAQAAAQMVDAWRKMPREEYEAFARRL